MEGTRKKDIREFVENYLLAKDSRALREYIREIQPDVDLTFFPDGSSDRINIPIGVSFFWPDYLIILLLLEHLYFLKYIK
jgi:hypothetical protein